ncbi:hypothetical protein D6745_00940 [Candidatus Woesearchaeota archaeon]|nr:MAG: hypothetical protein D6745_00940 [Candidatus Woesearchaeota archaeon]
MVRKSKGRKSKRESEDRRVIIFFVVVLIVFAAFLIPYFYLEGLKRFDFGGIKWKIEKYKSGDIYHGRFVSLNPHFNNTHNLYLRVDPRKNNVKVEGNLSNFRYGSAVSFDRRVSECKGDIPVTVITLGQFLMYGIGTLKLEVGYFDKNYSVEKNESFIDCNYKNKKRTIVILKMGNESKVSVSPENPSCYIIEVRDCKDIAPIEKFMVQSVIDFKRENK